MAEHDFHAIFDESTGQVQPELLITLEMGAALVDGQIAAQRQLDETFVSKQAAIREVTDSWQPVIDSRASELRQAKDAVTATAKAIGTQTIERYKAGTISDEEVIFVSDLVIGVGGDKRPDLDYEYAATQLGRFRQLQPGARVMLVSYSGNDVATAEIRTFDLYEGGILTNKPQLELPRETLDTNRWQFLNPQLACTLENGQKLTIDWGRKMVIGDEEAAALATNWAKEALRKELEYMTPMEDVLRGFARLAPLKLELPELSELKSKIVGGLQLMADDPDNHEEMVGFLSPVRAVDAETFDGILTKMVINPDFESWVELEEAIAIAVNPNWQSLSKGQQYLEIKKAGLVIAEKRTAIIPNSKQ